MAKFKMLLSKQSRVHHTNKSILRNFNYVLIVYKIGRVENKSKYEKVGVLPIRIV